MKKVLFGCIIAVLGIAVLGSCKKDPGKLSFEVPEEMNFEVAPGATEVFSFEIKNLAGASLEVLAESEGAGYDVEAGVSEDGDDIELKVTAPEFVFEESEFVVTITVNDAANGRQFVQPVTVKGLLPDNFQSFDAAANSFIVKPGAFVKIPMFKGNGTEKVTAAKAELVWQDAVGLVSKILVNDGTIFVALNAQVEGNAVVSALSADGKVLWSWSLWVTDYDPEANPINYTFTPAEGAPVQYVIMDRELGALTNELGTDAVIGNFYQWGRNTGFAGSTYVLSAFKKMYDINGEEVARKVEACANVDNTQYGLENPMVHFSGVSNGNYSWVTTDFASEEFDKESFKARWGGAQKGLYDPCPAGWKVGEKEAYGFLLDANVAADENTKKVYKGESTANQDFWGWMVAVGGKTYSFPARGEVAHAGSLSMNVGASGYAYGRIWNTTADTFESKSYFRMGVIGIATNKISNSGNYNFGYELGVRCVKE